MKKKIINGLLSAVLLVAATSSFVSCKDYEGDDYARLHDELAAATINSMTTIDELIRLQQAQIQYQINNLFSVLENIYGSDKAKELTGAQQKRLDDLMGQYKNATTAAEKMAILSEMNKLLMQTTGTDPDQQTDPVPSATESIILMWGDSLRTAYANAYNALINAVAAQTDAATAQGTANQAVIDAAAAQGTANQAVIDAATAQAAANQAIADAAAAQGTANQAVTDAATAQAAANQAIADAAAAQGTANQAVTAAANVEKALADFKAAEALVDAAMATAIEKIKDSLVILDQKIDDVTLRVNDIETAYKAADEILQGQINDLNKLVSTLSESIDAIMNTLKQEVTGIEIQGTVNPIYGTFAYPVGVQSNILAAYYGKTDVPVYFPAGDGEDADYWVGSKPIILTSELTDIKAPVEAFGQDGFLMNVNEGNAGKVYLTVNPSNVIMDGKEFTLRTSDNKVSKVVLSPLATCTEQLKWGHKRAAETSPNGFYVANATINKEDIENVALSFDFSGVKPQIKAIVGDWRSTTAADIAKLGLTVVNAMQADVPRLGVQAQWKDEVSGWKNWVSKYELAAFSAKPLGYDFLYGKDFSPRVRKIKNKLFAKEKAIAQEFYNEIVNMIKIEFGLPTTGGNIYVDEVTEKVYLKIPANSITISGEGVVKVTKGQFGSVDVPDVSGGTNTYLFPDADKELKAKVDASNPDNILMDITPLYDNIAGTVEKALAKVAGKAGSTIEKYLEKIINAENKIFAKIEAVAKNPNRFIQPALIAKSGNDLFYPSRKWSAPTKVKKNTTISFFPTTLTGEIVAPAFKKYVAVSGAWRDGNLVDASQYNKGGVLNTILDGNTYNIMTPFEYTIDAPAGTVLEFIYECLGYNGKVAGKKFYIEVSE